MNVAAASPPLAPSQKTKQNNKKQLNFRQKNEDQRLRVSTPAARPPPPTARWPIHQPGRLPRFLPHPAAGGGRRDPGLPGLTAPRPGTHPAAPSPGDPRSPHCSARSVQARVTRRLSRRLPTQPQPLCLSLPRLPATPASLSSPIPARKPLPPTTLLLPPPSGSRSVCPSVRVPSPSPFQSLSVPSSGSVRAPPLSSVSGFQRARKGRREGEERGKKKKNTQPTQQHRKSMHLHLSWKQGRESNRGRRAARGGEGRGRLLEGTSPMC